MRCETLIIIFYLYKKNKTLEFNRDIEIPMFTETYYHVKLTYHHVTLSDL